MPVTLEFDNGIYMSIMKRLSAIMQACIWWRRRMALQVNCPRLGQEKIKVEIIMNFHRTPWRVLSVADRVGGLWNKHPYQSEWTCKIEDTSWIKPCRTTFTWWETAMWCLIVLSPETTLRQTSITLILPPVTVWMPSPWYLWVCRNSWYYDDNFNFGWAGPNATSPVRYLAWICSVSWVCQKQRREYICGTLATTLW